RRRRRRRPRPPDRLRLRQASPGGGPARGGAAGRRGAVGRAGLRPRPGDVLARRRVGGAAPAPAGEPLSGGPGGDPRRPEVRRSLAPRRRPLLTAATPRARHAPAWFAWEAEGAKDGGEQICGVRAVAAAAAGGGLQRAVGLDPAETVPGGHIDAAPGGGRGQDDRRPRGAGLAGAGGAV